jgi:hypothetical protein
MGLDGQVQTSHFDAVNVATGLTRQVRLAGQFQAGGFLRLRLVPDDGTEIVAEYDPRYDLPAPMSDWTGEYGAFVEAMGRGGAYTLSLSAQGAVQMTSTQPGEAHCQASGALSERTPSAAQMDATLDFSGEGCLVPAGTHIEGFILLDRSGALMEFFGMDDAATIGVFMHAPRP